MHCRVLARLAPSHLHLLPGVTWQIMSLADMYLSGVRVRAPSLPYHIIPEFRTLYSYNPNEKIVKAALDNLTKFPVGSVFSNATSPRTKRLLQGLHGLVHAESRFDIEWSAPWANIYDVSYLLAQLQVEVELHGSLEERIALVGCQMQFWGNMIWFLEQTDIQKHQLSRLAQAITSMDPSILCTRWLELTGSLDLLLWTLCNAGVSVLQLNGSHSIATEPLPDWLQPAVGYILKLLQLSEPNDLRARLRQMPYTDSWNDRACQSAPVWSNTGTAAPSPDPKVSRQSSPAPRSTKFERLRKGFDYW
jgi:hypothetical protein